jgi:hypothetical protein
MLTKEELLEKGVPESAADEIIAAFEDGNADENSLQALAKALEKNPEEDLLKAGNGGDDDDEKGSKGKGKKDDDDDEGEEGEYNEKYMRKHMKRYMKENKKHAASSAKEAGIFGDKMEKAVSDFDFDAAGAVVEMEDLKPILVAQNEFISAMSKAVQAISEQVEYISERQDKEFGVMRKAARVTVDQAVAMGEWLGQPQGRKGKDSIHATSKMEKATSGPIDANGNKIIYSALLKATKNGDAVAGQILSVFESKGKNGNFLNAPQRQFIEKLLAEAK